MLMFLQNNLGTIVAALAVAFLVFLAVRRMVLDKRAGIGACGQKCAHCANACHCETPAPAEDGIQCNGSCSDCEHCKSCRG